MMSLVQNRWTVIGAIIAVCLFFACIAAMNMLAGMEPVFYYTAFAMLAIAIFFESLRLVGSIFQLFEISRRDSRREGHNTFVLLQLLQAAIVVAVSIGLLILLRDGSVPSWIMFFAVSLLSVLQIAAHRYRLYRSDQAEWFW